MTFRHQMRELARTDLTVEQRLGDLLRIILPFAVVALLLLPMALGPELSLISEIGFAVFWTLGLLFGMQVSLRQMETDTPERRDLYAMLDVDPAARFAGRVLSGSTLTLAFMGVMLGFMFVFYNPEWVGGSWIPLVISVVLVSIGLTQLGTLAGQITVGLRNRTSLASLIVAPLSLPLLVGAAQSVESVSRGASILPWVLLMLAANLGLAVTGVGLAPYLEETGL